MKIENLQEGVRVDGLLDDPKYPTLIIEAEYELGGMSLFSDTISERGVYVYFKRMDIGDGVRSYKPFNDTNFKVLALELKRKSKKKIGSVASYIQQNAEELANLYLKDDRKSIVSIIQNFAE